ncbi:MAG: aldehyde dehydrogenase family protein [Bdellovibrio sp.]|nr:aldehyde dehydrogenase family protein [Bdellovibrio sp.]
MKYQLKGNYYQGKFHNPHSHEKSPDRTISKSCPADLESNLWELHIRYEVIDKIVASAVDGQYRWRKTSIDERVNALRRFKECVLVKSDALSEAIALETGKPLWEAKTEVLALVNKVDIVISYSLPRILPKHFNDISPGTHGHIYYRPIGPCLIIGPFNFPCNIANNQIANALIAGNSIIFKPSEKTCYSGQLLIECYHEAGFPSGVINLAQGDGELARRILKEKAVKGIFFTGSLEVGKKILNNTSHDLSKLVSLELGGKNNSILCQDANLDLALRELIKSCFLTCGQRCISTAIVPIHRTHYEEFIEKFHRVAKTIIIDHPIIHDLEPFMGPLVDQQSLDNYLLYMGMAKREGIEEIMRGKHLERKHSGYYVSPSIHLAKSFNKNSHFLTNEIFGPNCTFIPFDEIEEAIQISNSTEFGLAASVFSSDINNYHKCLEDIDAGQINFNRSTIGANPQLPFGGIKNSGNYRPAGITTIDSCIFQLASLESHDLQDLKEEAIKGVSF